MNGTANLEVFGVDERIVLKCILTKYEIFMWSGYVGLRTG
jgi:hypothetical protein